MTQAIAGKAVRRQHIERQSSTTPLIVRAKEGFRRFWSHPLTERSRYMGRAFSTELASLAVKGLGRVPILGRFRPVAWFNAGEGMGDRLLESAQKTLFAGLVKSAMREEDGYRKHSRLDEAASVISRLQHQQKIPPSFWNMRERALPGFDDHLEEVLSRTLNPNFAVVLHELSGKPDKLKRALELIANAAHPLDFEEIGSAAALIPNDWHTDEEMKERYAKALGVVARSIPSEAELRSAYGKSPELERNLGNLNAIKAAVASKVVAAAHSSDDGDKVWAAKLLGQQMHLQEDEREEWLSALHDPHPVHGKNDAETAVQTSAEGSAVRESEELGRFDFLEIGDEKPPSKKDKEKPAR